MQTKMGPWQLDGELSAEVQGNILGGFNFKHARFAFCEVVDAEQARQWIRQLEITDGAEHGAFRPSDIATTIAFTRSGLEALGVSAEVISHFPESFRQGMKERWRELNDPEVPEGWDDVFSPDTNVHFLLSLYGDDLDTLKNRTDDLSNTLGLQIACVQEAGSLDSREHFGFLDGISQPVNRVGANQWKSDVQISEFLTFRETWDDGERSDDDLDVKLARLGTFIVYRKLEQDVFAFREFVQLWQSDPDHIAAKMMGRWPSGAPVKRTALDLGQRHTENKDNDFTFAEDDEGFDCPEGAHIRRVNPRSTVPMGDHHRILRRGMPYGPKGPDFDSFNDPVPENDGESRGLLFIAVVADIAQQFEHVQRAWIHEQSFHGLDGSDPIASTTVTGNFRLPGGRALPLVPFVTLRGGEYFFAPSIEALELLAENKFG